MRGTLAYLCGAVEPADRSATVLQTAPASEEASAVSVVIITGSAGLIGSEAARHFGGVGLDVVGIDNDMRRTFFGDHASTAWNRTRLESSLGRHYTHIDAD